MCYSAELVKEGTSNGRRYDSVMRRVLAVVGAAALGSAALRAHAQGCRTVRSLTPKEKAAVDGWSGALERLLPAPPAGWQVFESKNVSAASGTVCDDEGQRAPFWASVRATYLPADAPEFGRRKAEGDRAAFASDAQTLTKELQAAVQKGDTKRMQEISAQLAQIARSPQAVAAPPQGSSARRADVRLEVNFNGHELCDRATPASVPGAAFASRWSGVNCMLGVPSDGLVAGFGDFRPRTNFQDRLTGYTAGFTLDEANRPPARVYDSFVEIHGDAAAVDALVKSLDVAGLRGLVGK
jgi:hypothetical protein